MDFGETTGMACLVHLLLLYSALNRPELVLMDLLVLLLPLSLQQLATGQFALFHIYSN